jgi:hypothetical protein
MAVLDFPINPSVDDVYTHPTAGSYKWNGYAWDKLVGVIDTSKYVDVAGDTMTGPLVVPVVETDTITHDTYTNTLPQLSGMLNIQGDVFSAYPALVQASPSVGVWTKVTVDSEVFNVGGNYASSRFTPSVAGYYQVNAQVSFVSGSSGLCSLAIYKNGAVYQQGLSSSASINYSTVCNTCLYLNGSGDYIEMYTYISTATDISASQSGTTFSGFFVRGIE